MIESIGSLATFSRNLPKKQNILGYFGKNELCGLEILYSKDSYALYSVQVIGESLTAFTIKKNVVSKYFSKNIHKRLREKFIELMHYRSEYVKGKGDNDHLIPNSKTNKLVKKDYRNGVADLASFNSLKNSLFRIYDGESPNTEITKLYQ